MTSIMVTQGIIIMIKPFVTDVVVFRMIYALSYEHVWLCYKISKVWAGYALHIVIWSYLSIIFLFINIQHSEFYKC